MVLHVNSGAIGSRDLQRKRDEFGYRQLTLAEAGEIARADRDRKTAAASYKKGDRVELPGGIRGKVVESSLFSVRVRVGRLPSKLYHPQALKKL